MNLGMGVMLQMLGGYGNTTEVLKASLGKIIVTAALVDDALVLEFDDGKRVKIWDNGQSCCESRYMMTDDDLSYFSGSEFINIELRDGPHGESDYDYEHEIQFLLITTDKGTFTMVTHNEHNGYYGGFAIVAEFV